LLKYSPRQRSIGTVSLGKQVGFEEGVFRELPWEYKRRREYVTNEIDQTNQDLSIFRILPDYSIVLITLATNQYRSRY
jgi:hypothetical protein